MDLCLRADNPASQHWSYAPIAGTPISHALCGVYGPERAMVAASERPPGVDPHWL